MDLSDRQIKKLRQTELDILKCFINVCRQLNLKYFVVQGTLLGSVRHKGFIPWDDDIDVGMIREDYDIFLKKGQALMPDGYFLQTSLTDPEYPHGFAKIRNSSTAFVETTCKNLHMNHGIFIDVFPFDYYPENVWDRAVLSLKKLLLRYRIRCSLYIPGDKKISVGNMIRFFMKAISCIAYPSLKKAIIKQNSLYRYRKKSSQRINYGSPWGKRECIPGKWLNEITLLEFEGIMVSAPLCYKEYLTHVYGNYMELPPPEKRVPHHYISFLDFENAYQQENENIPS